ncbi:MAG: DUF3048 domain-containing protein [Acidimicrobiales bacterium]
MPARPRTAPLAVLLILAAALAGACARLTGLAAPTTTTTTTTTSTSTSTTVAPTTTSTTVAPTTTTTAPAPPRYALSGRPATDLGTAGRAAVAVKIDNIAAARPQAGILAADVVYEEFTEGVTRFIAVYHSQDAETVGPVRSVRPADPVIITPLDGVLAFSGGSPGAVAVAADTPLTLVMEDDVEVMHRRGDRVAPHNLYTSTAGLFSRVPADTGSPRAFATFLRDGQSFGGPGASPVTNISLVPADWVTADYTWAPESSTWLRSTDGVPHLVEEGRIAPTTVIVQFTPYQYFVDDYNVQYPEVLGSGDAWVFAAGTMVRGTWHKASPASVTNFVDSDGAPIAIPPGQTWVHLVAPGSAVTTG